MENLFRFTAILVMCLLPATCSDATEEQADDPMIRAEGHILVFSKTEGFRHDSIEAGQEAIRRLGTGHNIQVQITEDASVFTDESLSGMDAVVFLNTTGEVLNEDQKEAFENYIRNGGGFAGIHSATDTGYEWPWYNGLVGAYFESHPQIQNAVLQVVDTDHAATSMLPERWEREDEWYNFRDMKEDVNVLIKIDTDSYEGSNHPGDHPMS